MPLYEYKCESCGKLLEVIQKFSDTPLATHEECGGSLRRLISTPSLQFKGSGFYITDYGKGHNGKSSSSSGPSSESKSDSKSESKPASAPATKTETKSTTSSDSKS
ncbi:MAG: FmdB family zinc ribbon protein [Bryobacteraceae bacterium]